VVFDNAQGRLIIARSDGTPTYNLAVVDDWIWASRMRWRRPPEQYAPPDQYAACTGATPPVYAHLPMILVLMGRSSRRSWRERVASGGGLSSGCITQLFAFGWSMAIRRSILDEMIQLFDTRM
jgi:glutamyl/glutaminyl-tRNA synthetase